MNNKLMKEVMNGNKKAIETFGKIISFMITKRESLVCLDASDKEVNSDLWKMMEANIVQTGFCFSKELKDKLTIMPISLMSTSYNLLLKALKIEKGADVSHKNFIFPDFPNQTRVTDLNKLSNLRFVGYLADLMELFSDEEYHSFIGLGEYAKHTDRSPLDIDMENLIPIRLASMDDFYKTVANLLGSRMALNESDKEYIKYFLNNDFLNNKSMLPKEIPFKETWAMLISLDYEMNLELPIIFKNFFDFERAYASFIGADVSLSEKMNLKNLDNKKRLFLLSKLNEGCITYPDFMIDSMIREKKFVKIINNRLHPKSYGKRFEAFITLFNKVMGEDKIYSDNAKIEILISEGKGLEAIKLAISNPGDAIRRLAKILSLETIENQKKIIDIVKTKVSTVDLSVLLNTMEYFKTRNDSNLRVAIPKGNAKKSMLFIDEKKLSSDICDYVVEMLQKAIEDKLSSKQKLGKVFVDDVLKNYNVPFSTRNESKAFRSVARGSRLSRTENTDVIRAFVYKKIPSGGFVDLSCAFLNKEFNFVAQCSWTNLKTDESKKPLAMHSGDGYNCQKGLTEFIDIDLSVLRERMVTKDIRYVAFEVLSYNHIPFNKMDKCFFGIMSRKSMFNDKIGKGSDVRHPKFHYMLSEKEQKEIDFKGEVFEPSTVQFRFDLTNTENVVIPLLYDIEKDEFIWVDLAVNTASFKDFRNKLNIKIDDSLLINGNVIPYNDSLCVENLQHGTIAACYSAVYMSKPNLYDLFVTNVKARGGILVENKDEADIVCSLDGDVTPFYRDIITKDWM